MSRDLIPFAAADISALAKSLRGQLAERAQPPGHVEMLNMLARAAGARNFQHYRAQAAAQERLAAPPAAPEPMDHARIEAAARCFDGEGRMTRWPSKPSVQALCLWAIWAAVPPGRAFTEAGINAVIQARHLFGDHALLRREMFNQGLVSRTPDCRDYRRIERPPPPEALALIRRVARA
jgi:hypothetical protein